MIELPTEIYTTAQVRGLDRVAIEVFGIPSYELMCRAGEAALRCIGRHWPDARSVTIVCGAGNNAGDGYVLARLAAGAGLTVRALALVDAERLAGDGLRAYRDFVASGSEVKRYDAELALGDDLIVDALLGTGIDRPVEGLFAEAIAAINASHAHVLALDIPSGLHADSGQPLGAAVRATVTVTFVGLKLGLFLGQAPDHCGSVEFDGLGIPPRAYADIVPPARRLDRSTVAARCRGAGARPTRALMGACS